MRISYREVSVSHPEAVQILASPLWKSDWYRLFAVPNSNYNNLMSECDPKKHSAMRNNLASAYTGSSIMKSEPFLDKTIHLLENRLDELSQQKQPFDFGLWLHFLTWDINGDIMFSKRFGFLDQGKDVGNSIKNNFALALYITTSSYAPWLHAIFLGNPMLRWLDFHPKEHTLNTTVKAVAARKENTEARVDMMEQWKEQQRRHPDRLTEHDILCAAIANLGAGGETVGSVLQAFFYFLLKEDPLHLRNLREEIDNAETAGLLSPVVSNAEALKLPYLQACVSPMIRTSSGHEYLAEASQIKETLRVFPPVAWNLPRVVPEQGLTIASHHFTHGVSHLSHSFPPHISKPPHPLTHPIPLQTILSVNPWLIHRNQSCFGPDANQYNPSRWLADPATVKQMEKYLIPVRLSHLPSLLIFPAQTLQPNHSAQTNAQMNRSSSDLATMPAQVATPHSSS